MVFIPVGDDNSDRTIVPWCTYVFVALNVFVFVVLQQGGEDVKFTYAYACVPEEIITGRDVVTAPKEVDVPLSTDKMEMPGLQPTPLTPYVTLLTSIFMHGGWMHLIGNMLFLFIFGDNVEDRLGHIGYTLFYFLCGILASLAHVLATVAMDGNRLIPCLGASGAISGVLAGYVLIHPHRRVTVLIFRALAELPAMAVIGIWFAFQFISAIGTLGDSNQAGGVAYGAHIGGFLAGAALVWVFPWRGKDAVSSVAEMRQRRRQRRGS